MTQSILRLAMAAAFALYASQIVFADDRGSGGHGDHGGASHSGDGGNNSGDDHGNQHGVDGQPEGDTNQPAVVTDRVRVPLASTSLGASLGAEGHVSIRVQGMRQRLQVEVEANAADGATFNVLANGVAVGSITLHVGEGELELGDDQGARLPGGLTPAGVTTISVTDASGATVLQAQFGAVQTGAAGQAGTLAAPNRKRVSLTATPAGIVIDAHGTVDARVQDRRQRFRIEGEADVPDASMFRVLLNGADAGTLAIRFGQAELEFGNENAPLPAGLSSVSSIQAVAVVNSAGVTILQANL